jgi:hypothetical protein
MNVQNISRVKMDCNWMVKDANAMREQVKAIKLSAVTDKEQRLLIKIEVRAMDYNELNKFLKAY